MKTNIKKTISILLIGLIITPPDITRSASNDIVFPLQEVAKLECRFDKFSDLDSNCKEKFTFLNTSDYQKYATQNGWYNDYTRRYTVLWWATYTYWWDQWNGWHMWVDIATSEWTPVYSMADGEVIIAERQLEFWNLVSIKHFINWKIVVSDYGHLSKIDVKKWDKVYAWDKIWEVWMTWNATWNHLHFQIDLASNKFFPAYYSYDLCPYSYNDIVNSWKCFSQLQQLTVDPLVFLETSGAILNNLTINNNSTTLIVKSPVNTSQSKNVSGYIFNRNVYPESSSDDIKEVQRVFTDLWYYKWWIDWIYSSMFSTILAYQLNKWVIQSSSDTWAWYFWPKTRAQAKVDYDNHFTVAQNWLTPRLDTVVWVKEVKKISNSWMLTREQIEAMEIKEFQLKHNIKIEFKDFWNSVWIWESKKIWVTITDKKGKMFNWNTPYPISFIVDSSVLDVFPNKFYNFTDWKRDIIVTSKKSWNTSLYVKMGNETLQSFKIASYDLWKNIFAKSSSVLLNQKVVVWDTNLWAALFKDEKGTRLINMKFDWEYIIKTEWDAKICIKSWNINDIKNIIKRECSESQYVTSKKITYKDTISWIIIFNYKIFDKQANIKVYSLNDKKDLAVIWLKTYAPKWLSTNYVYYDDIMNLIWDDILAYDLKQWYFLEKRALNSKEAIAWIKSTLNRVKAKTVDKNILAVINSNLKMIEQEKIDSINSITRKDFLEKVYKYLVLNKDVQVSIKYRDLSSDDNKKANSIFDAQNTWKDKFWTNYYQPDQNLTRWEWAYLLSLTLDKNKSLMLTLNK